MPTILSDPPFALYLVLAAALAITGAIAASRQDRRSGIAFGIAILVLLLVFAIDRFRASPREEAVQGAQALVAAAEAKDPSAFALLLADKVEYEGNPSRTLTREEIRTGPFWSMLKQYGVTHVAAWDFSRDDVKQRDDNTVEIGFMAKGENAQGQFPVYIRATFSRQSDGKMKLTKFASFHPTNHAEPLAIPNFP